MAPRDGSGQGGGEISGGLRRLLAGGGGRSMTLGEISEKAGSEGTALLLCVLSVASVIPGVAPVFGLAVVLVAAELVWKRLPLPEMLARRRLSGAKMQRLLARWLPQVERVERWTRPRLRFLTSGPALRGIGAACMVSGVVVILPVPFCNIPAAAASLLLALGVAARDGLLVLAGLAALLASIVFITVVTMLAWAGLAAAIHAWL
jgi:hypothetical protein